MNILIIVLVAVVFFGAGYVTALPHQLRARATRKWLEQLRYDKFVGEVKRYSDLSWQHIKEHAAYRYTYLQRGGRHSKKTLKARMGMWWRQTAPRTAEEWVRFHVTT